MPHSEQSLLGVLDGLEVYYRMRVVVVMRRALVSSGKAKSGKSKVSIKDFPRRGADAPGVLVGKMHSHSTESSTLNYG